MTASSGAGINSLNLGENQTVNGTFTCAGTSVTARGFVNASPVGTARTITAAVISADYCDFRDITIAGAASPISPTSAGDCTGNTGITFPAAKTVYWNLSGTQNITANGWATSSGGTPNTNNFPLAQDTCIFDDTGAVDTFRFSNPFNVGTFDFSARTNAATIAFTASDLFNVYGNFTLGSGITVTAQVDGGALVAGINYCGGNSQSINTNGVAFPFRTSIEKTPSIELSLNSAFDIGAQFLRLVSGTFNANNYNVSAFSFENDSQLQRQLTMGSGTWTLNGNGVNYGRNVWDIKGSTGNFTFNKDTANIILSSTSTNARTFAGSGLTYNKLTIGGATGVSILTVTGANSFTELASTKTVAHTIRFSVNQGTFGTWSVTGTSGNLVTVDSSSSGTRRTFTLTNVTSGIDYLSVKDIGELSNNKFYVGANSTDGGNNSNVYFTASPVTSNYFLMF